MKPLNEQAIVEGYLAGRSIRDLAVEHGVSVNPIQRVLKKNGVERRPPLRGPDKAKRLRRSGSFSEEERAEVARRYRAGETQMALALLFNSSPQTIRRVLDKAGVPIGTRGQHGDQHHAYRGGRTHNEEGYVLVRIEGDNETLARQMVPKAQYILEHRLVLAQHLGRPLGPEETVHHVNGDKTDNRIENLQLHDGRHGRGAAARCRTCGSYDIEFLDT